MVSRHAFGLSCRTINQLKFWPQAARWYFGLLVFSKEGGFQMKTRCLFFALFICTVSCATVWGQAIAQINGTVSDPSGALIPGVEVTATQTETGISRTAISNESGAYILPNLPVGPYRIQMALAGFRTFVRTGIILEVNATRVVNAVLEVGQVAETVEVQADATMVETRATGVGEVITNTQILDLPLVGRETPDLIAIIGAAAQTGVETQTSRSFAGIARFTIAGGSDRGEPKSS
jgi:Carboxypeptidase regulatory-like domain